MRALLLFSWVCLPIGVFAENSRLDRLRHFHEATIRERVDRVQRELTTNIAASITETSDSMKGLLSYSRGSLLGSINEINVEAESFEELNYRESLKQLLEFDKIIREANHKSSDSQNNLKATLALYQNKQKNIEAVKDAAFCQTRLDALPITLGEIIYPKIDEIDLTNIPKPQYKGVSGVPGRTDDDSDLAVESGFMMASTTAGSAIGATIGSAFPGPGTVIGAVIGAGIGAIFGYCSGKGAVAAKVALENQELRRSYHEACAREEQRQRQEIKEANAWLSQNLLTERLIRREAANFCVNKWPSAFASLLEELDTLNHDVNVQLKEATELLNKKQGTVSIAHERIVEMREQVHAKGVAEISAAMITPVQEEIDNLMRKREIVNFHETIENSLFACVAHPGIPCAEKRICLATAIKQVKNFSRGFLGDKTDRDELDKFQNNDWKSREAIYTKAIAKCVE